MTTAMAELPKIKSSTEAGYIILMIASVLDGNYTRKKGGKIVEFLTKYANDTFDIDKTNETLLDVTKPPGNTPVFFHKAIGMFHELNDDAEIIDLIGFVHSVMCSDDKGLCELEKMHFTEMCKAFNQPDLAQLIN